MCHTEAIADIVILVDGSWSIGRLNFRLVRMFLENLVNAFDVGIDKTRIGGSWLLSFLNRWVNHGTNMAVLAMNQVVFVYRISSSLSEYY